MKSIIVILLVAFVVSSCGSGTEKGNDKENFSVRTTTTYQVDSKRSKVNWKRNVENKVENKQINLFGATSTVNMENVSYSTDGIMPVLGGNLVYINDTPTSAELVVNFTMVRLFSKTSEKTLSTEEFPPSSLKIDNIKADSVAGKYKLEGSLTIKDKTRPVTFPAEITKTGKDLVSLKGNLVLHTLDWPIREDADPARVKKDEITLELNLIFGSPEKQSDNIPK